MSTCIDCGCIAEDHPVLDEIADDGSYECDTHRTECKHTSAVPIDFVIGRVEVAEGHTVIADGGRLITYEPTGTTDVLWETAESLAWYCDDCGAEGYDPEAIKAWLSALGYQS